MSQVPLLDNNLHDIDFLSNNWWHERFGTKEQVKFCDFVSRFKEYVSEQKLSFETQIIKHKELLYAFNSYPVFDTRSVYDEKDNISVLCFFTLISGQEVQGKSNIDKSTFINFVNNSCDVKCNKKNIVGSAFQNFMISIDKFIDTFNKLCDQSKSFNQ